MALILNLETATKVCSVALAKDGDLLSFKEVNGDYSHAENLTPFIAAVLKEANLTLSQLDAIAVSKGPGSYTGLRIGVSTAKGLCYSLDKPLIAINTLEHTAFACMQLHGTGTELYCPMIDARRMEVYCAIYNSSMAVISATAAEIIDENSFQNLLLENRIYFFGDGANKCRSEFSGTPNALFIDDLYPSAKNMLALSERAFNKNQFENVAYFEPYYLKEFVAGKKKKSL